VVFVSSLVMGFHVGWGTQARSERGLELRPAAAAHWKQTLAGAAVCAAAWIFVPATVPWLAPVFLGLIFAIPVSMMLSSVAIGQATARCGLLITPAETSPPPVLEKLCHLRNQPHVDEIGKPGTLFGRLLADPALLTLHRSILLAASVGAPASEAVARRAKRLIGAGKASRLRAKDRKAVQSDPALLETLHLLDWNRTSQR
jgi:membrane glycosyltransferase